MTRHHSLNPEQSISLHSMAGTVPLSSSNQLHHHHRHISSAILPNFRLAPFRTLFFPKSPHYNLGLSFSTSSQSSSSPSSTSPSTLQDPFETGRFLTNEELEKLELLHNFTYTQELKSGSVSVRVMRADEMDVVVALLSESFAESMLLPAAYVNVLGFLVKQYLTERRTLMPHTATLMGFYREDGDDDLELAGTVEIAFNRRGANASPPTPTPPKDSPYVCNMSVKKPLRRRGIGWHLLRASEKLISEISSSREVYLHCRMIDAAPLNMYTKAGYTIVRTDSILILLTLQRRKHLMRKELQVLNSTSDFSDPLEDLPSQKDVTEPI